MFEEAFESATAIDDPIVTDSIVTAPVVADP